MHINPAKEKSLKFGKHKDSYVRKHTHTNGAEMREESNLNDN